MNRSTNTAPVSLSTSYLIGSPRIGISMITLQSFGTSLPAGTRSRFIGGGDPVGNGPDYTGAGPRSSGGIIGVTMKHPARRGNPAPAMRGRRGSRTAIGALAPLAALWLAAPPLPASAQASLEA